MVETRGKKKAFSESTALNAAMEVFWQKGYAGASLSDLTSSMDINKPSMYNTFGNKETLFLKTTEHYIKTKMLPHMALLNAPGLSLKTRLKNHIMSIVNMQCDASNGSAKGCYLVLCQSELASGTVPPNAAKALREVDLAPSNLYEDLFLKDKEAISAKLHLQAAKNGLAIYTLLKGTASMARTGITAIALEHAVDTMLNGLGL
ncbi:TetR/AcrR family transcriptional regulator [Glaciecola sp. 2405UD65-10]|uniref:TetR/AcrR family transcriptional regulator n=1 Tax=Glaciecola sp. 2405UD65-10 TaxID=3397244 RepID=UPI003B5954FD